MTKDWRVEAGYIWPELVDLAQRRATSTYGELGKKVDVMHRNLRHPLDLIARHVQKVGLPPLTIVIVNGDTGLPGDGIGTTPGHYAEDTARVFNEDWSRVKNPFAFFTKASD